MSGPPLAVTVYLAFFVGPVSLALVHKPDERAAFALPAFAPAIGIAIPFVFCRVLAVGTEEETDHAILTTYSGQ